MGLHDLIVQELENTKSLAALIWLVERGREVEFALDGREYFLSIHKSKKVVSLWDKGTEQSFESMEQLLEKAVLDRRAFLDAWKDMKIETIF